MSSPISVSEIKIQVDEKKVYLIGPRKVGRSGKEPVVYLGKDFEHLLGKKVMLILQVLEEKEKGQA